MDQAINAFLITVAIVGGILSPFILIVMLNSFGNAMQALAHKLEGKTEEIKKAPPFDDVAVNMNPLTKIVTVRFIKNGAVIWQGDATRRED